MSRHSLRRSLSWAVLLLMPVLASAQSKIYSDATTPDEVRFGAQIGAGASWRPVYAPAAMASAGVGFGGSVTLSCSGIDFHAFLKGFNTREILRELKETFIAGAQAAVFEYLITLAYANPTIASVLDMMDKRYSARFSAFAQACNAQEARRRGMELGAKRMAEAGDECFTQKINSGASANEAYRQCARTETLGKLDIPAKYTTDEFLHRYTTINVTSQIRALFRLLPDDRIEPSGYEVRPPQVSVAGMTANIEARARAAIERILEGEDPSKIPPCPIEELTSASAATSPCLPGSASGLVASPAFLAVRALNEQARDLYASALASQIAMTASYSNILELHQQIAKIDLKPGTEATGEELQARRKKLMEDVTRLREEADLQSKVMQEKLRLARTQFLAIERAEAQADATAAAIEPAEPGGSLGVRDFIRLFVN